jgi:hypothetical protein
MRGDLVRLALGSFLFCCNALVASGASAQTSWAIGWQRDLANAATVTHWDFKADGTVCARFIGAKAKDKCADDGKWQLRGEVLCWELQRIGESYGFKAACVRVRKVDEKRYEAIAEDGRLHPPLFYPVK